MVTDTFIGHLRWKLTQAFGILDGNRQGHWTLEMGVDTHIGHFIWQLTYSWDIWGRKWHIYWTFYM